MSESIPWYIEYTALAVVIAVVIEAVKQLLGLQRFAHHRATLRLIAVTIGWLAGFLVPGLSALYGAASGALSTAVYWAVKRKLRSNHPEPPCDEISDSPDT
jgi:hypothetical protein